MYVGPEGCEAPIVHLAYVLFQAWVALRNTSGQLVKFDSSQYITGFLNCK
jgi:hypothetical protein